MSRLITALIGAGLIALGVAIVMLLVQRRVLFPRPWHVARSIRGPTERIQLAEGGALFLPPSRDAARPAPLLLFTHGNAETADEWVDQFAEFRERGWAILLVEYPGYAGTTGSPSEASIIRTTIAAYDAAHADPRVDGARIVAYGRSLGSGAATQLAAKRTVAAIIIESGFTSVRPLAARLLVPGFLVRDPFDNLAALRGHRGPLLVLHGRSDEIIPFSHGEALARAVPGATLIPLPCGHNDCPRPWAQVLGWLDALGLRVHGGSPAG